MNQNYQQYQNQQQQSKTKTSQDFIMDSQQTKDQKILVLGGTNFMGKSFLDMIAKQRPTAKVYCINRGKIYWNDEVRKQHRNFHHFIADRKQHRDSMQMIKYLNQKLNITQENKWRAVIDFSAFKWRDVQSVLKAVNKLTQRYIYISTDSVYNNQTDKMNLPVREEDFEIESECRKQRKYERKNDKYGYVIKIQQKNKLKCEVYIKRRSNVPSYCLRLPDVIGPFDNTDRFWTTLEWVKRSHQHPIPLSIQDQQKKLSFVYSLDVARLIIQIISEPNPKSATINVAFAENPTLEEFIRLIAKSIEIRPTFRAIKHQSNNCYPSTDFGHLSVSKLLHQHQFQPSNMEKAIQQSVNFFMENDHKYDRERHQMQRMLHKKIKNSQ